MLMDDHLGKQSESKKEVGTEQTVDLPLRHRRLLLKYKIHLIVALFVVVAIVLAFKLTGIETSDPKDLQQTGTDSAIQAGRNLAHGNCTGSGTVELTHSPMKFADFGVLLPYGLVTGGHVTPIDHGYFSPADVHSARDAYEVYAMADGAIVDISLRSQVTGSAAKVHEYRFVFSHTCTFLTYFDLVTSLAPDIKEVFDANQKNGYFSGNIPVKAGQLVGSIGGQTLDYAVWNTEKPLTGFIHPEHYASENWKIYTDDPFAYFTPELSAKLLKRNPRVAEPLSGKIDYDIQGKLIGNWFREGSNYYEGDRTISNGAYWGGHFSIAPNYIDPSVFTISLGDFEGEAMQFISKTNSPLPEHVSVESGIVKYDLVSWAFKKSNGQYWDYFTPAQNLRLVVPENSPTKGCLVLQMLEAEKLKFELFPGKTCVKVKNFTASALIYTR